MRLPVQFTAIVDADELAVLFLCGVATLYAAARWAMSLFVRPLHRGHLVVASTPVLGLIGLLIVLLTAADIQVREHGEYIALFMTGGGAVLGLTGVAMPVVLGTRHRATRRLPNPSLAGRKP